jgi:thiamine biosynthesis lipoprotein
VDLAVHDLPVGEAEELIARCVSEMQRLEALFSLYLPDSSLCQLNREGRLGNPPGELVNLVRKSLVVAERSGGIFDPTVQPYWQWLREVVEAGDGIDPAEQVRQLSRVDYRQVRCAAEEVSFGKSGMAMTFNGIAQGWITDRACELLRESGARHCLVNLGEFYALGGQCSGQDWLVGLRGLAGEEVSLRNRALAVSSGSGFYFGTGAGRNHLIDPRSGACAEDRRVVAVTAGEACLADALSTACAVMGDEEARALIAKWEGVDLAIHRSPA